MSAMRFEKVILITVRMCRVRLTRVDDEPLLVASRILVKFFGAIAYFRGWSPSICRSL